MSTRDRLTVASALAVVLASAALMPVYDGLGWFLRVAGAVAAVAATGALARLVGVPRLLQPLAGLVGLGAYTAVVFAGSTLAFAVVPTVETFDALGELVGQGLVDVEELAAPVPTTPGLVLLAVLGTGAIAVVVDALAVVLRKAAVAGLPLLLLFAVPSAVLPGGLGALPFVLGAAGWLGLLLADSSDQVSRWGTPLRSSRTGAADPSLGRVGRRIGAAALGVAVVVPLLVPGLDGRLLGDGGGGSGLGGSRTTTTYNPILSLAGQLRLPAPRDLFTWTTDGDADYVRLTTLDVFTEDSGWSSSDLQGDPEDDAVQDGVPAPLGRTAPTAGTTAEFELAGPLDGPWLPAPAVPDDVEIDGPWIWDPEAETVFSTRTALSDVEDPYVVRSSRVLPDVELLRRAQDVPSAIAETYAQRPELSAYSQELLDRTTADQVTTYDKVAAIQRLFRETGGFEYSEDASVPATNAPDALENFLIGRKGFCEQYSSAMAALVRALGVPARVAIGFTTGQQLEPGSYLVTTDEAHAWPEVWFAGAGWVRFEPTPRTSQVSTPGYSIPPRDEVADEPAAAPTEAPIAPETGPTAGPSASEREDAGGGLDPGAGDDGGLGLSPWLLTVPAALLLLALPALLAAARRRRSWRSPDPLVAWAGVQDDAVDVGHAWRPADSPAAAAVHLLEVRHLDDTAAASLHRLARAAERARYARAGASDADVEELREDAGLVREGLLRSAEPRDRWQARLAPRSTLRWASAGLGTRVADGLDRVDSVLSAVGSRLRHPRTG